MAPYQAAAVGITLTAASRVYLMEPSHDPAQEVQAAGRSETIGRWNVPSDPCECTPHIYLTHASWFGAPAVHRLGQTKDVHIHRFAFNDSVEEALVALHTRVASGDIKVEDGTFSPAALNIFTRYGVATPHSHVRRDAVRKTFERWTYDSSMKRAGWNLIDQACTP